MLLAHFLFPLRTLSFHTSVPDCHLLGCKVVCDQSSPGSGPLAVAVEGGGWKLGPLAVTIPGAHYVRIAAVWVRFTTKDYPTKPFVKHSIPDNNKLKEAALFHPHLLCGLWYLELFHLELYQYYESYNPIALKTV